MLVMSVAPPSDTGRMWWAWHRSGGAPQPAHPPYLAIKALNWASVAMVLAWPCHSGTPLWLNTMPVILALHMCSSSTL